MKRPILSSLKLPESFDPDAVSEKFPMSYHSPLNTVLVQEMGRYNVLLDIIRNNLGCLQRAVSGYVTMTKELESSAKGTCSSISNVKRKE